MNNLIKRYNNISLPVKASFWFMLSSILQQGISFITVPIFTRLLSPDEFGLINVYQAWLAIVTLFATLTLWGGVFNNGMIKFEEDRDVFLASLQGLSTTITISLLFIFLLFRERVSEIVGLPIMLILLMFIQITFIPSLNLWSAKQRFDFKYKKLVLVTILISILNPSIGVLLVVLSKSKGIARVISIALVQIVVGIILYIQNLKTGKKLFNKKFWKYAFAFNVPLIPHYLSQTILNQADRIMINNLIGSEKAGIYSIAYSIGMILMFVVTSINSTFTPWVYKKLKNKEYEIIKRISLLLLIIISILILFLVLFAPEIIKMMAPVEYGEAVWIIPPIAISLYFIFLYGLFATVEFYFEENKFIMVASVIASIINIILNLVFIPVFGYFAAGYTTLVSYVIYSFSHYIFMKKILLRKKIHEGIYDIKNIVFLSLILLVSGVIITLTYNYIIIRFTILIILFLLINHYKKIIIRGLKILRS